MIFELIIVLILGILVGIISGLTPGIHINMISVLLLSIVGYLTSEFGLSIVSICSFIIVVGITHTFLDAIPSIFLGAPNDSTALGILPGHRYLLSGNGMMAVKLFTIGSLFGIIIGIVLFPIFILITKYSYLHLEKFFVYIIILTVIFMIWRDNHKFWALFVFFLSGAFGILVFSNNIKDSLFPMFSGLYGISTLLISLNDDNHIPVQKNLDYTDLDNKKTFLSMIAGNISSFIVSTFPGLSSSIAAVISVQFFKDLGDKGFMMLMGCIGTCSFILSLVALYVVNKARNGAVVVIAKIIPEINIYIIIIFLVLALITAGISTILTLKIGKIFSRLITKINYKKLVYSIIVFVTTMVVVLCSWKGLLVLIIATAIGLIPGIVKIQRTHSMGCLILPVILFLW